MPGSEEIFDYVIVGAGTAGCVLANRLSADPRTRVALIEAGPPDKPWAIHVPAAVAAAIGNPALGWGYTSTAQAHLNGRSIALPRGRVLGGCSSINGMVYFRGHPRDFDDWAANGAPGWSYADVLPYFKRSENNEAWPDSPLHGRGGPMNVIDIPRPNPLIARFLEATTALGFKRNADFGGADVEGFGARQATIRAGRRESMVTAYLNPIGGRGNLVIYTEALVTRVDLVGLRATGVSLEQAGIARQLKARCEVILCAGAYATPQLLQISGIGDGAALQALGISVRHHLPGVGADLQDHPAAAVQMRTRDATSYGMSLKALPRGIWNVLEYGLCRSGPLGSNVFEATGFVRTRPELERPDLQLVFMPAHRNANGRPIPQGHGYGVIAIGVRPKSRGRVSLASPDPHAKPLIDANYLAAPEDLQTLLHGLGLARQILAQPSFAPLKSVEILPGPSVQGDADLEQYIRNTAVSVHHPTSTCRMGADAMAVVDEALRVRGVAGLRVVDASVMPVGVAGNCNAAIVMIAEKAADLILSGPSQHAAA